MKQRKIILVLLTLATIILELFPCGAVLNFGRGLEEGGGLIKETYSYFSLLPVGYANFGPFITALLSCLLFVIALLFLFANKGIKVIKVIAIIACLTSLSPLLFGFSYFSIVGVIISLLLCAEVIVTLQTDKQ